ncbi:MAG TPA: hypothetical protein VLA67_08975 [Nitrospiraceae bacterium]|nr:hypothetical protein [Nitrospiraceae bacterium]
MALTTLLFRLQQNTACSTYPSCLACWIALGLIALCIPPLVGCSADGPSGTDFAIAKLDSEKGRAQGRTFAKLGRSETVAATISLAPTGLAFSAMQGGNDPSPQTVTISNSGTETLSWSVSTTAAWLSLSATAGTTPASFTVTPIIPGLAAGTYSTTITVTAVGATNSPHTIPVDLTISSSASSTAPSPTPPVSVSLIWEPVAEPGVVGYYVHYGLQSPNSAGSCAYTQSTYYPLNSLDASSPAVTVSGLAAGTPYFFAVSAYNGVESACSNEVWTVAYAT